MRVGLLGGSFDPVHYGHLRAAEWAREAFDLKAVRLVPARQSPFKGPPLASAEDRRVMLTLATAGHGSLEVETCELDRPIPSYTVDTLRTLTARAPKDRLVLILGSDAAAALDQWQNAEEVRRLAEIRVLPRPGEAGTGDPASAAFQGLFISSSALRRAIRDGHSVRYLTPEPVRHYIEAKGLYA